MLEKQNQASKLPILEAALNERVFSGYQLFAEYGGEYLTAWGGYTSYWPNRHLVSQSTLFDLGSLTKVVATAAIIARLLDKGVVEFDAFIEDLLPTIKNTDLSGRKLRQLLCHSSGYVSWVPIFREIEGRSLIEYLCLNSKKIATSKPLEVERYSDLNYLILGLVVDSIFGTIDKAFESEVKKPLQLSETLFGPLATTGLFPVSQIAATEYRSEYGRPLQGEIFDENAEALGGKCGHAGLFSTARSLAPFCREWLRARSGKSAWLSQKWAMRFSTRACEIVNGSWCYGWDSRSVHSTSGSYFSPESFGHLGYPGTSIWIDPKVNGYVIFLCNRVHPLRVDERIRNFRPILHDQISLLLGGSG